jgi:hypothetical protein
VEVTIAEHDGGDERVAAAVVEIEHFRDDAGREVPGDKARLDPVTDDREVIELGGGMMPARSLSRRSLEIHAPA